MQLVDSYSDVAEAYAAALLDELVHKPLDRWLLERLVERTEGPVCDLGCGPGQVARYLKSRGADALGVDLSPGMVALARRLHPDIPFEVGDMRALEVPDGAWGGIAAFYAIVHFQPEELPPVFAELHRVLRPGGWLLLAFHVGDDRVHADELFGVAVDLDFVFHHTDAVTRGLTGAGFDEIEAVERSPYEAAEHPSTRAYVFAHHP